MTTTASTPSRHMVGSWLLCVALLVVVQIVLGGITRLTDSGLSITEWKPILGVIPPLDDAGWDAAFAKYQEIPQFKLLKSHLAIDDFKKIYFWEWFHRLWGRLLGLAFFVPFVVFLRRGLLHGLKKRLLALFILGGLQGAMGWIMVASGLADRVYVSHLRLAVHFVLAAVLLVGLLWVGLTIRAEDASAEASASAAPPSSTQHAYLRRTTDVLLALYFVQLTWGALMAGLKAALIAPTWPTINGAWMPTGMLDDGGLLSNPLAVHFVHRTLAYVLVLFIACWAVLGARTIGRVAIVAIVLVFVQATLGVLTTVWSYRPGHLLVLGVSHQSVAIALLATLVVARHRLSTGNARSPLHSN